MRRVFLSRPVINCREVCMLSYFEPRSTPNVRPPLHLHIIRARKREEASKEVSCGVRYTQQVIRTRQGCRASGAVTWHGYCKQTERERERERETETETETDRQTDRQSDRNRRVCVCVCLSLSLSLSVYAIPRSRSRARACVRACVRVCVKEREGQLDQDWNCLKGTA